MLRDSGREKEKLLAGSVKRFGRPDSLDFSGPLSDKEYETILNRTARELSRGLKSYKERNPDEIRALQAETLGRVRNRVQETLKSRLRVLRGSQEKDSDFSEFATRIHEDLKRKTTKLMKGARDADSLSFRIFSSADTLLDYAGGVDFFVDMVRKKAGGEEVLATTLVDLKSRGQKERTRLRADKMTDLLFYYQPGWVTRAPDGSARISPSFFSSSDYEDFINQAAEHLYHQAKYFGKL